MKHENASNKPPPKTWKPDRKERYASQKENPCFTSIFMFQNFQRRNIQILLACISFLLAGLWCLSRSLLWGSLSLLPSWFLCSRGLLWHDPEIVRGQEMQTENHHTINTLHPNYTLNPMSKMCTIWQLILLTTHQEFVPPAFSNELVKICPCNPIHLKSLKWECRQHK